MTDDLRTSTGVIALRSLLRKLGITTLLGWISNGPAYEDRFSTSLINEIREEDCVWDVGANIGHYTTQFAASAASGSVFAFKPTDSCASELARNTRGLKNVEIQKMALGNKNGEVAMLLDDEELAATHRIVGSDEPGTVIVNQRTAKSLIDEHPDWMPNLIKIDVEGFEGEVLEGLEGVLSDDKLRCIGIEVHFGILANRNMASKPKEIVSILQSAGFEVIWVDSSHLIANRDCDQKNSIT